MKELTWFCIGIVFSRWGIPILWHVLYLIIIGALLMR